MKDFTSIWIVIPTYNEAENISSLLTKIGNVVPGAHVVVVDDASPDGTAVRVSDLARDARCDLRVLRRAKKMGIGSAIRQGFQFALEQGAQTLLQMDADGSHDPAVIPEMLAKIAQGADVVVGSRRVAGGTVIGWGATRTLMSRGAAWFSGVMLGLKTKDVTSGFKAYRRKALEVFDLARMSSDGYAFQEETIFLAERHGFRIVEIPIVFQDRSAGRSKLSRSEILKFFIQLFRLRFL